MKRLTLFAILWSLWIAPLQAAEPKPIKILFLGDSGHHKPAERFRQMQPVMAVRGIELVYTDKLEALNLKILSAYDGLIIYANSTKIEPEQEAALIEYVESGKGFIPLHCASYCFLNSPKYIDLVGAQFQKHGTGTFRTILAEPEHPIMKGFGGFESWDETYVHTMHNAKDRTVLEYRTEGKGKEPWTWVRTQGKGRVFYTAWGHDERTWANPGFQNLVERGIRWAVGQDPSVAGAFADQPQMTAKRKDVEPFEYVDANIAFYPPKADGSIQRPKQMQKPVDAAESMKHIVTPVGFEAKLFLAEPNLAGKPICMNWDERGRLWIAETVDYPNEIQPEGKGRDRIRICEDTDGDGVADKFTIFAENLSIPTSFAFWNGGIIVHQAPHTLFLKASDGGDVADVKKVLFTGWATNDTHAGPSNLRYGLDNQFTGIVGYAGFNGEIGGEKHSFRMGLYRFNPSTLKFEFLRGTNNNSWGVGYSEEGILFGSTANGCPSVYMPIPNRYYESVRGWSSSVLGNIADSNTMYPITDKVRQVDWHGGFTAAAGHALYTARTYPREYWNNTAFVTEPTGHLVATFQLTRNGSDFRSRNAWNLLASDDEWTAPTMAEVGPDGNVWVVDWYSFIVQHNPTPQGFKTGKGGAYETELRDKKHGRVYRLVRKDAKVAPPFTLKDATPEKLVATLKNDNMFWRLHAQRLLVERGKKDVVPELLKVANDAGTDEIGLNVGAIHALWTLHGLGVLDGSDAQVTAVAVAALKHKSAGVRRNALQVLPRKEETAKAVIASGVLQDTDAQVRLAALLALADLPSSADAAKAIVQVLSLDLNAKDRWISEAATSAAAANAEHFLKAVALSEKPDLKVVQIVAEHLARGPESKEIPAIFALMKNTSPAIADAFLAGFAKGWPKDRKMAVTGELETGIVELFPKLSSTGRGHLLRLSQTWGSSALEKHGKEIAEGFLATLKNEKATDAVRIEAATNLVDFRLADLGTAKTILELLTPSTSPELARGLIDAVGKSEAKETPTELLNRLGSLTPASRTVAFGLYLVRREWTPVLLTGIEEGKLHIGDLSLDQQRALASHSDRAIAKRASKLLEMGGGLPNVDRQKVIDELIEVTKKKGDPEAGKLVFKNQCSKCHIHGSEGTRIGPDLTGMAVHSKEHLLIDILDPSRSVEGNYRIYRVTTTDGKTLNGLLASETKTTIEIIDAEAKKYTVLRQDIEELKASTKSLMPEGFEKQVKTQEIVDLLEFLTQRGKYLPIPLDKAATVVSTKGMFIDENATVERLIFSDWKPKTFEGVPFQLVDPQGDKVRNAILLFSTSGTIPTKMPKSVMVPCNAPAKTIHMLGGISGWGYPFGEKGSVSLIVRLHYEDGTVEDHAMKNGEQLADYIHRVDVPGSKFAFDLQGRQMRYITVTPKSDKTIKQIEFVKGPDKTAPVIMAVTVEGR